MTDLASRSESFEEMHARIVGLTFPGGVFRVEQHERWLSHEAMKSPQLPVPDLHPVWILLGALRGMGLTTVELVGLAGAGPQDGVLFGETELEQLAPLRTDVDYRVTGGVIALDRRQGRRSGTFDVMTFRLEIADADTGETVAVNSQSFIIKRSHDARH
jgi:hypothetical protein